MELRIQRILSFFAPAFERVMRYTNKTIGIYPPSSMPYVINEEKLNEEEDYTTMCDRPTA